MGFRQELIGLNIYSFKVSMVIMMIIITTVLRAIHGSTA